MQTALSHGSAPILAHDFATIDITSPEQTASLIGPEVQRRTHVVIQPREPRYERGAGLPVQRAGEDLGQRIRAAQAGGSRLPSSVQQRLERGLGADLSGVRVHTDNRADQLSRSVAATAFTTGSHIFFRSGAYRPKSAEGMRLLAHEATHTVQQAAGPVAGTPTAEGVSISDPGDRCERAAEASAARVMADSRPAERGAAAAAIQRETDSSGLMGGQNRAPLRRESPAPRTTITIQRKKITVGETTLDTDDYEAFKSAVYRLSLSELETVKSELEEEAAKYKKHLDEVNSAISAAEVMGEEQHQREKRQKQKEKQQKQKEKQQKAAEQSRLRKLYEKIDSATLDDLLKLDPLPGRAVFELFRLVWTQGADPGPWSQLLFEAIFTHNMPLDALQAMVSYRPTLLASHCKEIVKTRKYRDICSEENVKAWAQAIADKGHALGKVPDCLDVKKLLRYVFEHGATLAQIQLLSYARDHREAHFDGLLGLIVTEKLGQGTVVKLDHLWHIPLPVCSLALPQLSLLTLPQIDQLDQAAAAVTAGGKAIDDPVLLSMIAAVGTGAASLIGPVPYVVNVTLYSNLQPAVVEQIVLNNGPVAAAMLPVFNQVVVGCPAKITWELRNDLNVAMTPGNAPPQLYAPTMLGQWNLYFELIVDLFNWRGRGASHSGFTFADVEAAKAAALGVQGLIPNDGQNHDATVLVRGRNARIVLNRTFKRITTLYWT